MLKVSDFGLARDVYEENFYKKVSRFYILLHFEHILSDFLVINMVFAQS